MTRYRRIWQSSFHPRISPIFAKIIGCIRKVNAPSVITDHETHCSNKGKQVIRFGKNECNRMGWRDLVVKVQYYLVYNSTKVLECQVKNKVKALADRMPSD